jgi:DNA-binding LacI/PurR family transcriptional regulator
LERSKDDATLGSVARAAGVSVQTVSNVLNAPHKVRPSTLARVEAEVARQGYRPNRSARSLRIRRAGMIGYCVRHPEGPSNALLDRFLHAVARAAEARGHHVLLFTADPESGAAMSEYRSLLAQRAVDGFVISDTTAGDHRQAWLAEHHVPFAAFGRRWDAPEIGAWIDVDGAAGVAAAVEHVVGLGHQRVAFVGWPEGSGVGDDRARGFVETVTALGLPHPRLVRAENGLDNGRGLANSLLDETPAPTAFVCVSDDMALGCDLAVRDHGLVAGRDIAITGFDDTPAAGLPSVALTSIHQPVDEAGETVVRLLVDQLTGATAPGEQVLLAPTLIVRTSTDHPDRRWGG